MTIDDLMKAQKIFNKYMEDGFVIEFYAQHDQISYNVPNGEKFSDDDLKQLEELSIHYSETEDFFYSFT